VRRLLAKGGETYETSGVMMDIGQWLIVLFAAALVAQDTTAGPQIRFCEPIVAGPVVGWLLGVPATGLIIGVAAQLIWCGTVPAGLASFYDANSATVSAVAIAAVSGATDPWSLDVALTVLWIAPVGLFGSVLTSLSRRLNDRYAAYIDTESSSRRIAAVQLAGWGTEGFRGVVVVVVGTIAGLILLPWLADGIRELTSATLFWAGIFGAGVGVAVGVTWQFGKGRFTGIGIAVAAMFALMWRLFT
jgi:mannose/fructose/N-acetylgalactosamine-specific phosphotransferase system component IIC